MLLDEYKNQNKWRQWERYLNKIPLNKNQIVYDLGCSMGFVSKLLAQNTKKVIGFDNDEVLLKEAAIDRPINCEFILQNIFTMDPMSLKKCDGIWMSYAIAYMQDPNKFIEKWVDCLNIDGWIALIDIDGLFSCHLSKESKFYKQIELFEQNPEPSKVYDFQIGRKLRSLMEQNGLDLIVAEDDWFDKELNFCGRASKEIMKTWNDRLERMVKLKEFLGKDYDEFKIEFLNEISKEEHESNGGVKFYVGVKKKDK